MPTHRHTPFVPSAALLLASLSLSATVHAASLTVVVTDLAGKPLVDAVALLDPAAGKVAVKPGADVEISQARRTFIPRVTLITTGTKVT